MLGICRPAFTLIEILITLAIIAIMGAIIIPNLRPRDSKYARQQFVGQLNALVRIAAHNAAVTNKTQKVFFDFAKGTVRLEIETDKIDKGEPVFESAKKTAYGYKTMQWPKQFEVKNFYIEGYDEMTRYTDRSIGQVWFFIVPEGTTQAVTINLVDTKDRVGKTGSYRHMSLVLNPFSAQFKEYDLFQKP